MQRNNVIVDMDRSNFWFCKITKEGTIFTVLLLADLKKNIIYTLGGESYSICKNKKQCKDNAELYDAFMRKIGKMCKKVVDNEGHYFSNLDGFTDPAPKDILRVAQRFERQINVKTIQFI